MEIGVIGAGDFGQAFAKRALKAGHNVKLGNSRGPASLLEIVNQLGPGAVAATSEEVVACEMVSCCALGQRSQDTCKSSQVEKSDSD